MIEKKILILGIINSFFVALLIIVNWMFLKPFPTIFQLINLMAFFVLAFPFIIFSYRKYRKSKNIETMFGFFLRDFVENIRGGLTVPQAFKALSKNDYGDLTPYVKKMAAQIDWGIPVEDVLVSFAKEVKSKNISRVVSSVIESHRFGGNLADTFQGLLKVVQQIERLRKERMSYLQSQIITGYIVFFVFLGVMIGMAKFLVPSMTVNAMPSAGIQGTSSIGNEFRTILRNLILIQGFFAGIAIGKMAEGSEIAGLKHSFFMMFIGGLMATFFA